MDVWFAGACFFGFLLIWLFLEVLEIGFAPPPKTQEQWEKEQIAKNESIAKWREEQKIK